MRLSSQYFGANGFSGSQIIALVGLVPGCFSYSRAVQNSTFYNPMFPGSYPDPSCIFLEEWDNTFFCATSTFNIFPGIPIHASKDLQNWKLISHALSRDEQLPMLAATNGSTSGLWAPAIRYHDGYFYLMTTLVHDKNPIADPARWDNVLFKTDDPFKSSSWSNPVHFNFTGYDPSPFWHDDGTVFVTGAHPWQTVPGIFQTTINLESGEVGGEPKKIWDGTGGLAPEGPHIYQRDGYFYLLIAEGGTGIDHMVTIARSKNINGPYESNPANPILTNANSTEYFQTVGHSDLFQDESGNWWSVALSTRSGPDYLTYPMGRETVLTPVAWDEGEWPVFSPIRGEMSGPLPAKDTGVPGEDLASLEEENICFEPDSNIPGHFVYWRLPTESYTVSEPGHPYTLSLKPSKLNLMAHDGNYAPTGQTFIGVRQSHTFFNFRTDFEFSPSMVDEEAGVSVFLTMNHHIDLGIVMLPAKNMGIDKHTLAPHFRFRAESSLPVPEPVLQELPHLWWGKKLTLGIEAFNSTHYAFSAGLAHDSEMLTVGYGAASPVSWGFTGTLIGAYSTSNGGEGTTKAYLSEWKYTGEGQMRE